MNPTKSTQMSAQKTPNLHKNNTKSRKIRSGNLKQIQHKSAQA